MAIVTQKIGPISAYAIAKEEGYTGTKAEFAQEIGNAAANAHAASESASAAAASADSAADSAAQAMSGTPEGYAELVGNVGHLKSALSDSKKQIENYNEMINPKVYDEDDITTGAAWAVSRLFEPIFLRSGHIYVFTLTFSTALGGNGYFSIYNGDGTSIYSGGSIASGSLNYTKTLIPDTDVNNGYVTVNFGVANVGVHAELSGINSVDAFDELHNEKNAFTDATENLIGSSIVGLYTINNDGSVTRAGNNNLCTKEMIVCLPETNYTFKAFTSQSVGFNYYVAWYAQDGNFIIMETSYVSAGGGYTLQSPSNAAFMRFKVQRDNFPDDTRLMIVQGTTAPSAYINPLSAVDLVARNGLATKYEKPSGGIPASDIAPGVIPNLSELIDDTAGDGTTNKVWSANKVFDEIEIQSASTSDVERQVAMYNEMINPEVYDRSDIVTGAAWANSTLMRHIFLQSGNTYDLVFTIPTALETNGYINIFNGDGTSLYGGLKFTAGTTSLLKDFTPDADVNDGYITIGFGNANVSVHLEIRRHSTASLFDDIDNYNKAYTEETANLCGYSYVGHFRINSSGVLLRALANNFGTRDLIPCSASTAYAFRAFGSAPSFNYTVCWYDSNGAFLSLSQQDAVEAGYSFTSPSGAAYMRFSVYRSPIPEDVKLCIVAGSTPPSTYVPQLSAVDVPARENIDALQDVSEKNNGFIVTHGPDIDGIRYKRDIKAYEPQIVLEQGAFDGDGLNIASAIRLRSRDYIAVREGYWIIVHVKYNGQDAEVLPIWYTEADYETPQLSRRGFYTTGLLYIGCPKGAKYLRLYINYGGTTVTPENATITFKIVNFETALRYVAPQIVEKCFSNLVTVRKNMQDIAVYNGHIFDFGTGVVSIDGGDNISITNEHGNNAQFGTVLHGDFPYLYCPSWDINTGNIYVNQYSDGAFTLVETIHFDLSGYLNACVDEANERVYILLNTSETTSEGAVDFIVGDMQGNVISRKTVDNIPYIAGMTFYGGHVYVTSGYRTAAGYPSCLTIFDTSGNIVSKTSSVDCCEWDAIEGFDIDQKTGIAYLAMINVVLT